MYYFIGKSSFFLHKPNVKVMWYSMGKNLFFLFFSKIINFCSKKIHHFLCWWFIGVLFLSDVRGVYFFFFFLNKMKLGVIDNCRSFVTIFEQYCSPYEKIIRSDLPVGAEEIIVGMLSRLFLLKSLNIRQSRF